MIEVSENGKTVKIRDEGRLSEEMFCQIIRDNKKLRKAIVCPVVFKQIDRFICAVTYLNKDDSVKGHAYLPQPGPGPREVPRFHKPIEIVCEETRH